MHQSTMRFGSTAKVLLKCKLKYYRISECREDVREDDRRTHAEIVKVLPHEGRCLVSLLLALPLLYLLSCWQLLSHDLR